MTSRPFREIRAASTPTTVRVYQAYSPSIAHPALRAGRFVSPFKRERMTWIKPSFLWMMYRCGYGQKPDQEVVLGIDITRAGFESLLSQACVASFEPELHGTREAFEASLRTSPVRVQWDPERTLTHEPLPYRAIQIGIGGACVAPYVDEYIVGVEDVTPLTRAVHARVRAGDLDGAAALLPEETPYEIPAHIAARIGCSSP